MIPEEIGIAHIGFRVRPLTLLQTRPATIAGLVAFLDHVDAHCNPDKGWDDEWGTQAFPTLAAFAMLSAARRLVSPADISVGMALPLGEDPPTAL
jgi:hypothetical protein